MMRASALPLFVVVSVLFLASACAGAKTLSQADLAHRRFVLASVDGVAFAPAPGAPDIEFGEGFRVYGRICNRYSGPGTLENGVLTVERMISTKMLCPDAALNEFESLFARMLRDGVQVELSGKTLTLRGGGHVLVYTARDWV